MTQILFFLLLGFISNPALAGETRHLKVSEALGESQLLKPSSNRWEGLGQAVFLEKGQTIRTAGPQSAVEIILDQRCEGVVFLGPETVLKILETSFFKARLEKGEIFILREREDPRTSSNFFEIEVPAGRVDFNGGGLSAAVSEEGTWIKVFADDARVLDKPVTEGFKFFIPRKGNLFKKERMQFFDYASWEIWIKKWYKKKDDKAYSKLW